jgi:hypothetical protein
MRASRGPRKSRALMSKSDERDSERRSGTARSVSTAPGVGVSPSRPWVEIPHSP